MNHTSLVFVLTAALGGCGTLGAGPNLGKDADGDGIKTIVPNRTLNLAPSVQLPLEGVVAGIAAYLFIDPLAPNWRIVEEPVRGETVRINLRRKAVVSGGEGEAMQLVRRRADELRRANGYTGYTIVEYTEGIESVLPIAQRVASAVVQFTR